MIDASEVKRSVEEFIENPYWREYYEGAPSEACKKYIELDFYYSDTEDEEASGMMDILEDQLEPADWAHLAKYAGNNPLGDKCRRNAQGK